MDPTYDLLLKKTRLRIFKKILIFILFHPITHNSFSNKNTLYTIWLLKHSRAFSEKIEKQMN